MVLVGTLPEDRRAPVLSLPFYKINLVGIDYLTSQCWWALNCLLIL
jgi:hypothetical protein